MKHQSTDYLLLATKQKKLGRLRWLFINNFPPQAALVEALTEPEEIYTNKGLPKFYEALANDFIYADPKNILVMADNHDMDRIFTQLHNDKSLTKMALTYLLTVRGIPQIFYGTEILMDNTGHHKVNGLIRSDFRCDWKDDYVGSAHKLSVNFLLPK